MYRFFIMLVLSLLLAGCGAEQATPAATTNAPAAITVTDDYGNKVILPHKPQKIMTTHIYLDNMLLGLVEPERMLSVSKNMDKTSKTFAGAGVTQIANKITMPGMEAVFSLKPDLFIVHDLVGEDKVQAYRAMGVPVYVVKIPMDIKAVQSEILKLSQVVGEKQRGETLVKKMDKQLSRIEANIPKDLQFSKSAVLVAANHSFYGGKGCMYDDVCQYAKVRNGIADLGIDNGQTVSKEVMIQINPDYFFLTKSWNDDKASDDKVLREFLADKSLADLQAVKQRHIALIDEKYIFAGHQNCVWSVQKLAHAVYGDKVALESEEFLKGF